MTEGGRYLDARGAAAYTGLSLSFVQKLCARRRLPFIRIGRRVVFDKALLDKWLSRRAVLPKDWGQG